ncbi:MAG: hypothetical protein BWX77_01352 [Bacteroidetes bacterium ADurb.Bin090]|nr:MAG: hypothetical protein BWX77_01352 [Bacteroidetes bacterium ADurb.Bin090]
MAHRVVCKNHDVFVLAVLVEVVDAFFLYNTAYKIKIRLPILNAKTPLVFFVEQTEFIAVGGDFAVLEDVFNYLLNLLVLKYSAILLQRQ